MQDSRWESNLKKNYNRIRMLLTPSMMMQMPAERQTVPTPPATRSHGTVKFYDPKRKYGMATLSDGREVFILQSSLPSDYVPVEKDNIEFDVDVKVRSSGSEKLEARDIVLQSRSATIHIPTATATATTMPAAVPTSTSSNHHNSSALDVFSVVQATNSMGAMQMQTSSSQPSQQQPPLDPFGVVQASAKIGSIAVPTPSSKTKTKRSTTKQRNKSKKKNNYSTGETKQQQQQQQNSKNKNKNKNNCNNRGGKKPNRSFKKTQNQSSKQQLPQNTTPAKFAESTLFQSPDPSRLPMPKF